MTVEIVIYCDRCGALYPGSDRLASSIREQAKRRDDWRHKGTRDICHECRTKGERL